MTQEYEFPDMREALYSGKDIDEIREYYKDQLRATDELHNILYANTIDRCLNMITIQNLNELEREFHDFKEHMRRWAKAHHIHITLKRRQKDFLGLNEKIRLFILTNQSLDKILDFLGFRIILGTNPKDSAQSIQLCYDVLNEVINFFAFEKCCTFLAAEPRINTSKDSNISSLNILVPETSSILAGFENNVKDYIVNPKKNGYQSLHVVIRKPNGLTFEIQIRTFAMDVLAEFGSGKHREYKKNRYLNSEFYTSELDNIDFSKIHIPGFTLYDDGTIIDQVGLARSIDPLQLL